ncbi:hypothetical protein BJ170DRAFT_34858 [Xylariales sp. AK1849]|nr:hypothetical protein BJ170DRAFT_34858 [Xylariales sp. AK1849]
MASSETRPTAATTPPTSISLRAPSKYLSDSESSKPSTTIQSTFVSPPLDWLCRTWSVTHSTLSMWRSARNVRITYKPLPSTPSQSTDNIDDMVEYEKKNSDTSLKSVEGVDKPDPDTPGSWNWRGKGWLKIASSHWEVLGWGEQPRGDSNGVERWVVTWFAPTLFTKEGLDVYSDRREGLSPGTVDEIMGALKALDAPKLVELVAKEMRDVEVKLPWKEKS